MLISAFWLVAAFFLFSVSHSLAVVAAWKEPTASVEAMRQQLGDDDLALERWTKSNIESSIGKARAAQYSDLEIWNYLSSLPQFREILAKLKAATFTDREVQEALGLSVVTADDHKEALSSLKGFAIIGVGFPIVLFGLGVGAFWVMRGFWAAS